ncbi:hypothetical protein JCM16774_0605 [Pseudoleptotrichia goodfellowii]|uniref:Uncharacterized protein n=1 Tax=Pseudoleptotrichia goodfellowii TaxID=157692 RepID=A0A510J921_9FUSO|nr:hypothetical protein [Pseudoleptotrichia goodfellowii]BBM35677.1 hypothetical protein JCM16774_0605 [Pseudoleptotrichia goodfellowii]
MKVRKAIGLLAGLVLLMTQISYSDPAVDRLLREARKRQAEEAKQEKVEEVTVEETPVTTETPNSIQKRAAEIKENHKVKKVKK